MAHTDRQTHKQTHKQTDGHGDSMTDPAQRAESVKTTLIFKNNSHIIKFFTYFSLEPNPFYNTSWIKDRGVKDKVFSPSLCNFLLPRYRSMYVY